MKRIWKIILTISVLVIGLSFTQNVQAAEDIGFENKVNNLLDNDRFAGTLLVIKNGQVYYTTSRGFQDFGKKKLNNQNTSYEIDSVQKVMTAAMIMKQVELGKLSLDDTLNKFYPSIPGSSKITIRQMLDMKSGLVMNGTGPKKFTSDQNTLKSFIKTISFSKTLYNNWYYSPINYNLMSGILEKITGKTYQTLFTDTYISPLKLKHTEFAYDNKKKINKAQGYTNIDPLSPRLVYDHPYQVSNVSEHDELGTGQIFMNAKDLYKVENYILAGNMLTPESRAQLFVPASISNYGGGYYNTKNNHFSNGWSYGYQTVVHLSDDGNNAVIMLSNYQRISATIKPAARTIFQMINTEN